MMEKRREKLHSFKMSLIGSTMLAVAAAMPCRAQAPGIIGGLPGDTLRYTLDGSIPTAFSPAYLGPLFLTRTTIIKARVYRVGTQPSEVYADTVFVDGDPLPITLTSFTAARIGGLVYLQWATASEIDNYGFEIERDGVIVPYSFQQGHLTTNEPHNYEYWDTTSPGHHVYRLKQIDLNGTVWFSDTLGVDMPTGAEGENPPTLFTLRQNAPNPFNSSTCITYSLPERMKVRLTVYNLVGEQVALLFEGEQSIGEHAQRFDASNLASGIYLYKLEAGKHILTRKMVLLK
jgi:hypothetical protein